MNRVASVYVESAVRGAGECTHAPPVGVAHFERDVHCARWRERVACDEVETGEVEGSTILQEVVVAVGDVKDVVGKVFFHDKPRAAAQTQAFALPDGVKPITFVFAHFLACLEFDDIAFALP